RVAVEAPRDEVGALPDEVVQRREAATLRHAELGGPRVVVAHRHRTGGRVLLQTLLTQRVAVQPAQFDGARRLVAVARLDGARRLDGRVVEGEGLRVDLRR